MALFCTLCPLAGCSVDLQLFTSETERVTCVSTNGPTAHVHTERIVKVQIDVLPAGAAAMSRAEKKDRFQAGKNSRGHEKGLKAKANLAPYAQDVTVSRFIEDSGHGVFCVKRLKRGMRAIVRKLFMIRVFTVCPSSPN